MDFYFTFPRIDSIQYCDSRTLFSTGATRGDFPAFAPSLEEGSQPREEECWLKLDVHWERVACLGFSCKLSFFENPTLSVALYLPIELEIDIVQLSGQVRQFVNMCIYTLYIFVDFYSCFQGKHHD